MDKRTVASDRLLAEAVHLLISNSARRPQEADTHRTYTQRTTPEGSASTRQTVRDSFHQIMGVSADASPDQLLTALRERFKPEGGAKVKYIPPPPGSVPPSLNRTESADLEKSDEWAKDLEKVHYRFRENARDAVRRAETIALSLTPVSVVDQREVDAARDVLLANLRALANTSGVGPYSRVIAQQILQEDLPRLGVSLGLVKGTGHRSKTPVLDPVSKMPQIDQSNIVTFAERQALADFVSLQDAVGSAVQSWSSMVTLQNTDLVGNLDRLVRGLAVLHDTANEVLTFLDTAGVSRSERRLVRASYSRKASDVSFVSEPARFDLDLDSLLSDVLRFTGTEAPGLIRAGGKIGIRQVEVRARELMDLFEQVQRGDDWRRVRVSTRLSNLLFDDMFEEITNDLARVTDEAEAIVKGQAPRSLTDDKSDRRKRSSWRDMLVSALIPSLMYLFQRTSRPDGGKNPPRATPRPPGGSGGGSAFQGGGGPHAPHGAGTPGGKTADPLGGYPFDKFSSASTERPAWTAEASRDDYAAVVDLFRRRGISPEEIFRAEQEALRQAEILDFEVPADTGAVDETGSGSSESVTFSSSAISEEDTTMTGSDAEQTPARHKGGKGRRSETTEGE